MAYGGDIVEPYRVKPGNRRAATCHDVRKRFSPKLEPALVLALQREIQRILVGRPKRRAPTDDCDYCRAAAAALTRADNAFRSAGVLPPEEAMGLKLRVLKAYAIRHSARGSCLRPISQPSEAGT